MLVLGYATDTDAESPSITVPPFHTGHLGFVPETPVRISLVAPPKGAQHCEVVVTPPAEDLRSLAWVSAVMRNEPGVVARLVMAVAALGINIVVQESSSVNRLDNHYVSLLVDMSEASLPSRPEFASEQSFPLTPTAVRRSYRDYESLFPVRDLRFVRLFESIMAHCADVIVWEPVSGEHFPAVDIRPYWNRKLAQSEVKKLVRDAGTMHVRFDLPVAITRRIKRVVGKRARYEYLLVSDTDTRALHVFFLHSRVTANLFHVGFFHDDVPGALATIQELLRDARFNILTSLVRKEEDARGIWEAVLEFQGDAVVPPAGKRLAHSPVENSELEWIRDQIVAAHQSSRSSVLDYDIVLGPPKYPRPEASAAPIPLSEHLNLAEHVEAVTVAYDPCALVAERRAALAARELDPDVARKSEYLLSLIEKGDKQGELPVVFLSYSRSVEEHADKLRKRLDSRWRIELYQEPDGEVIADAVKRKIEDSDYFIGIWHHEEEPPRGERTKAISPWMHFEYGVAFMAEKPAIVVHSSKLDQTVWQRVAPGISNPEYTDLHWDKTVETIVTYCERHFR